MGPRPSRLGAAALAKGPCRPAEIVQRRSRPAGEPSTEPLPAQIGAALSAIVRDLRDVPRDCLLDRAELLFWLRRMAGRVEGVGRMRVSGMLQQSARPVAPPSVRPATPRDLTEAVFGKGVGVGRPPGPRTFLGRRGQSVRIETRRATAAEQMELGL